MQEPEAFAQSLDSYLDSLSNDELRALVLRSIKRLDGAHRAQLGLFLGFDLAGHPIDEVAGNVDNRTLTTAIASCALLRERFGAFLQDNPRAIPALGNSARDRILGPPEKNRRLLDALARAPVGAAALLGVVTILAFVPLFAQYSHQRGMLAGLSDVVLQPIRTLPLRVAAHPIHLLQAPAAEKTHTQTPAARVVPAHPVASHQKATPPRRFAARKRPSHVAMHPRKHNRVRRIARVWKFDPKNNPYFNRSRWHVIAAARSAPAHGSSMPANRFAARSAFIVTSYLHALIAGNTAQALGHLGLPSNAPISNLAETPIISRNARTHVLGVSTVPDGRARVEVDIRSGGGEYYETFYVAHDGPAVRIMDRFYVPVNRTAEDRAARLLAKDGH